MIGFYDYTVVLTYISLMCSVFGITQAIGGHYRTAIICLALSGLFDMFDGKIARTKKNRTDDEKLFGVQIDSLCDVVCFGAFPAVICYVLGVRGISVHPATAGSAYIPLQQREKSASRIRNIPWRVFSAAGKSPVIMRAEPFAFSV